jgi:hypothetical protein
VAGSTYKQDRITAAQKLLPFYEDWRKAAAEDDATYRCKQLEVALWKEVEAAKIAEIPTANEHAVGRWIARILNREWNTFDGVI